MGIGGVIDVNMESKMFVRYGIPGWYLIISIIITLRVFDIDLFEVTGLTADILSSVIVTVLGVPVGYALYQLYFLTTHKKHKNSTPDWNVFVYSNVKTEDRDFINGRYSHMLRSIHELGVLKTTFQISIIIIYIPLIYLVILKEDFSMLKVIAFLLIYTIVSLFLLWAVMRNYHFKQAELKQFIKGIKEYHRE